MNKIIKNAIILTVITLVAGLGLGFVYEITKEPIAQANESAKKEAWQSVFPEASLEDFESMDIDQDVADQVIADLGVKGTVDEVCSVKGGEEGYVITTTDGEGYGGNIQITVGITADGTVSGISFLSISETAGLGMNAKEASFRDQYKDKAVEHFNLTKSDPTAEEDVQAVSGATITSTAMTNAVNAAVVTARSILN